MKCARHSTKLLLFFFLALFESTLPFGISSGLTPSTTQLFAKTRLLSSPYPWEDSTPTDGAEEETLMRLRLSLKDNVDIEDALAQVQAYTQSFPFAAVLPVQPMQYLPTHDGGVDVLFLRKKTKEKGSVDGGMRFFINDDDGGIDVLVKRNSQGQVVSKMFSEKLIVQSFVKALSGEEHDERLGTPPIEAVAVESVFHKWLNVND